MASDRIPTAKQVMLAAGLLGSAALLLGWLALWAWGKPPQIGADEEVFATVDALFTAVTARDEKLLGQCEQRLGACKDAGKLPSAASDYLDGIIHKARAGQWTSAAERLYAFMSAQRREGGVSGHAEIRSAKSATTPKHK